MKSRLTMRKVPHFPKRLVPFWCLIALATLAFSLCKVGEPPFTSSTPGLKAAPLTAGSGWTSPRNEPPRLTSASAARHNTGGSSTSGETRARIGRTYANLPLSFEANEGQADPHFQFLTRGTGYALYLSPEKAVLALRRSSRDANDRPGGPARRLARAHNNSASDDSRSRVAVLAMRVLGATGTHPLEPMDKLPGKANYFTGREPAKWQTNISTYRTVAEHGVYPGIDLVYYGNQGRLEYDFVISPGAD